MSAAPESTHDLIVVGAGPAGASAAIAASACGLRVALLDEAPSAGGQLYRAPHVGLGSSLNDAETREGDALRQALGASAAQVFQERRVWTVTAAAAEFTVSAIGPSGAERYRAPRLVSCTGAHERVTPFPGWTLPGVIGLAAATALMKAQGMAPGRRVVVAGSGPLLAAVATKCLKAGAEVVAVVDLASRWEWLRALPGLARRPALLGRGMGWMLSLVGHRVPLYFRSGIRAASGAERLDRVEIGAVDSEGAPIGGVAETVEADCLAVGHGLTPGGEIPKLLGAATRYAPSLGGWVPVLDADGRSSVRGLYAAGDGVGVRGGAVAMETGALTGLAAAFDAGAIDRAGFEARARPHRRRLAALSPFSNAAGQLMRARPRHAPSLPVETIVCRCEDVTRGDVDAAFDAGARTLDQLKHFTRCGMGPCQGRFCGETAAELLGARLGDREAAGRWTQRPPLRPIPLEDLIGDFTYDDIPTPAPAPL